MKHALHTRWSAVFFTHLFRLLLPSLLLALAPQAMAQGKFTTVKHTYAGTEFKLLVPPGYCVVERESETGKAIYPDLIRSFQGMNVVGPVFIDCAQWKAGKSVRYGFYILPLRDGKEQLLPPKATRAEFIAASEKAGMKEDVAEAQEEANLRTGRKAGERIGIQEIVSLGHDEYGVYSGVRVRDGANKAANIVTAVSLGTVVKNGIVKMNLYDRHSPEARAALLVVAKDTAKAMVAANP